MFTIYGADGVRIAAGPFKGEHRSGTWSEYDPAGHLAATGRLHRGVRYGDWIEFAADGRKISEGRYLDGEPHGRWTEWLKDGRVARGSYHRGRRQGAWSIRSGLLGKTLAKGDYRRGKQHGLWRYFDRKGVEVRKQRFKRGRRVGGHVIADAL